MFYDHFPIQKDYFGVYLIFRHTPISTYINHILIRLMVKTNLNWIHYHLVGGIANPLKNDGVRQLG